MTIKTIGIVGMGLIGASFAKAISSKTKHRLLLFDISREVMTKAELYGLPFNELSQKNLSECDLVLIALYPQDTINYIKNNAAFFGEGTIVLDLCGVKRRICEIVPSIAREHGFRFVGGHPMAGLEKSGFEASTEQLFEAASMILVPITETEAETLDSLKEFFLKLGFGAVKFSTPSEHDKIISYTSQLPHLLSNAFIKSPFASMHMGFSAGSFKDFTRVAFLNEKMWAELFLENSDFLVTELDDLIKRLGDYKNALENGNTESLQNLLADGRIIKEKIDRQIN